MTRKNNQLLERLLLLNEVMDILYQVNDFKLAAEIILDTCSESLQLKHTAILHWNESESTFKVSHFRNLPGQFVSDFQFGRNMPINQQKIDGEQPTLIPVSRGRLLLNNRELPLFPETEVLALYPVKFQEKVVSYLMVAESDRNLVEGEEIGQLMQTFATQVAPVLASFEPVKRTHNSYETIISKIIKDRVNEARLSLQPISFAVFRIGFEDEYDDVLILDDDIKNYQKIFHDKLDDKGDLLWLTVDTAFFIYTNADIFAAETLCVNIKEAVEAQCPREDKERFFTLCHACMSFPQSGENASEIISNLWLKLFRELRTGLRKQ